MMPTDQPAPPPLAEGCRARSGGRRGFRVHGLSQALAACAAAADAGAPILLLSAPGAAQFAGIGWFKALVDEARALYPQVDMVAMLDCGDAAGRAMQAMSQGLGHLIVDPRSPSLPRLLDLAGRSGTVILTGTPVHIDLGTVADPEAVCRAALAGDGGD